MLSFLLHQQVGASARARCSHVAEALVGALGVSHLASLPCVGGAYIDEAPVNFDYGMPQDQADGALCAKFGPCDRGGPTAWMVAVGTNCGRVRTYDHRLNPRCLFEIDSHSGKSIGALRFIDGNTIASGSEKCIVAIHDVRNVKSPLSVLLGHQGWIRSIDVVQNSILSGGYDGTVRNWGKIGHLQEKAHNSEVILYHPALSYSCVSPCEQSMAISLANGRIFLLHNLDVEHLASPHPDLQRRILHHAATNTSSIICFTGSDHFKPKGICNVIELLHQPTPKYTPFMKFEQQGGELLLTRRVVPSNPLSSDLCVYDTARPCITVVQNELPSFSSAMSPTRGSPELDQAEVNTVEQEMWDTSNSLFAESEPPVPTLVGHELQLEQQVWGIGHRANSQGSPNRLICCSKDSCGMATSHIKAPAFLCGGRFIASPFKNGFRLLDFHSPTAVPTTESDETPSKKEDPQPPCLFQSYHLNSIQHVVVSVEAHPMFPIVATAALNGVVAIYEPKF